MNEEAKVVENTTNTNNTKKQISKKTIIVIAIAVILIGIGLWIYYFQSNKRIIAKGIDNISTTITDKLLMNRENLDIGNDYTLNGDLTFNLESDYLKNIATQYPEYQTYSTLITNLSKTKNKITFVQDKTNKKLLMSLDSKYNASDLINVKYLIENNTEYYYIKVFMDSYINNGTSNYFEALDNDTTLSENLEYVYNLALSSFEKNLKDDYFTRENVKQTIDSKEKSYQKIILTMNNNNLKEIATNILKDLKADQKANKILTSIDEDFKKAKVSDSEKILEDNEKMEFSVYADNFTYIIKKYDFKVTEGEDSYLLTYEVGDTSKLMMYSNNELQGLLNITTNKDDININILDKDSKNIGKITITKSENNYKIAGELTAEDTKVVVSLDTKISNIKKNTSYEDDTTIKASITSSGMSLGNININLKSKIKKGANIKEDTSNVTLASDVTQEKSEALMNSLMTSLTTLMS